MKSTGFFLLLLSVFFLPDRLIAQSGEQIIFSRIEFVFKLKEVIDLDVWKSVNDKKYDVPLVYFTEKASYVANPTQRFLATFKSRLVYHTAKLNIYKTAKRIDDQPFHMFTGMTMGTPTRKYDYHSPFMKCSSFEVARNTIRDLQSTEEWATFIVHEYFHGFQYKHSSYLNYLENSNSQVDRDSLQLIYTGNSWIKAGIDHENELLVKAIEETDQHKAALLVDSFFVLRGTRRNAVQQKLKLDMGKYERMYETMEGTARYIEYSLYARFKMVEPSENLVKADTSFRSFGQYRNYSLLNNKWLYSTDRSAQYFYATGFNLVRLLDKWKVPYKDRLFKQGELSLEEILKTRK